MSFGNNLKKARAKANYTQEQFSEMLGISRQSVSIWESDSGYPEVEKLLEIAKILNVSLDWLFYGKENYYGNCRFGSIYSNSIFQRHMGFPCGNGNMYGGCGF